MVKIIFSRKKMLIMKLSYGFILRSGLVIVGLNGHTNGGSKGNVKTR